MADTCSTCRYWVPNDEPHGITSDYGWGECRCHPPQVVQTQPSSSPELKPGSVLHLQQRTTVWPITTGEQGCGEHKEKKAKPTRVWVDPRK